MKAVWILLAVLFAIILFLLLSILFYRPHQPETAASEDDSSQPTQGMPVLDENRFEQAAEALEEELARIWPQLWQNMSRTALDHVYLLFHDEESGPFVVLSAENAESRRLIFNAVDSMMKEYEECCSFCIVIPLTKLHRALAYEEADSFLKKQARQPYLILMESNGLKKTSEDQYRAEIGCGQSGLCHMKTDAEADDSMLEQLRHALSIHITASGRKIFEEKRKNLPFMLRLESHIPFFQKKAFRDFLILYPEAGPCFYASLSAQDHELILEGREETMLEEDAEAIRRAASLEGLNIKTVSFRKPVITDRNEKGYDLVSSALRSCLHLASVQSCLLSEADLFLTDMDAPVVWFSPLYNGKPVSLKGSADFYRSLLKQPH